MPTLRQIAVLVVCDEVVGSWPLSARIALRDAVIKDVSAFSGATWSRGHTLIAIHSFREHWDRGLPWPPRRNAIDHAAVKKRAQLIAAFGREVAERLDQR